MLSKKEIGVLLNEVCANEEYYECEISTYDLIHMMNENNLIAIDCDTKEEYTGDELLELIRKDDVSCFYEGDTDTDDDYINKVYIGGFLVDVLFEIDNRKLSKEEIGKALKNMREDEYCIDHVKLLKFMREYGLSNFGECYAYTVDEMEEEFNKLIEKDGVVVMIYEKGDMVYVDNMSVYSDIGKRLIIGYDT